MVADAVEGLFVVLVGPGAVTGMVEGWAVGAADTAVDVAKHPS